MELTPDIYERIVAAKLFMDLNYHEPINLEDILQGLFFTFPFSSFIQPHLP